MPERPAEGEVQYSRAVTGAALDVVVKGGLLRWRCTTRA